MKNKRLTLMAVVAGLVVSTTSAWATPEPYTPFYGDDAFQDGLETPTVPWSEAIEEAKEALKTEKEALEKVRIAREVDMAELCRNVSGQACREMAEEVAMKHRGELSAAEIAALLEAAFGPDRDLLTDREIRRIRRSQESIVDWAVQDWTAFSYADLEVMLEPVESSDLSTEMLENWMRENSPRPRVEEADNDYKAVPKRDEKAGKLPQDNDCVGKP